MAKVSLVTLGCKTNQYESAALGWALKERGHLVVGRDEEPDLFIINTCTVTDYTDYQCRQAIRRCQRANPKATLAVTGCYAQVYPQEICQMPGVDFVLGHQYKFQLQQLVEGAGKSTSPQVQVAEVTLREVEPFAAEEFPGRTRSLLKIQDGCDAFCSYCVVPYARGRSRSLPAEEVIKRVKTLAKKGYKEVVVTGIHLGAYGRDLKPLWDLTRLIQSLLKERWPVRFRISSLEPNEIDPDLIQLLAKEDNLCPHLHLSLQSGDNDILARMHRNYQAKQVREVIQQLVRHIPEVCLGADIIVGFPGESESHFGRTYELLAGLPLAYLHIFPFSARPGTEAARMTGTEEPWIVRDRVKALKDLSQRKRMEFMNRFIGKTVSVLVERSPNQVGTPARGFTANYLPVALEGEAPANELVKVRIAGCQGPYLLGQLI